MEHIVTNTIYSIKNCHYCDDLKRQLKEHNIEYIEKVFDLDNLSKEDREFLIENKIDTFPTFIKETKTIIVNPTFEQVVKEIRNY